MNESLRIGELAKRTGVSVRTLHHYHDIGILVPLMHSQGEQRLYTKKHVVRLQRIKSLQALGLSLDEVKECLERPEGSLQRTVERHTQHLEEAIESRRGLLSVLRGIGSLLAESKEVPLEELLNAINNIVANARHYTPEDLRFLAQRGEEVGPERMASVQNDWSELFAAFDEARAAGTAPDSEETLALARRAQALIAEFTGGNAGVQEGLQRMYAQEGGPQVMARNGMDVEPETWEYCRRVMQALGQGGSG